MPAHERLPFLHRLIDLFPVRKVVGQRRVDVSQFQVVLAGDLVGAVSKTFVPDDDVSTAMRRPATQGLPSSTPGRDAMR